MLTTHFSQLLKNIRPPEKRLKLAQSLPADVRKFLTDHKEFATLDPHTILVGAYGQDTCVGDVKDVDFLVRVPGDPTKNEPNAKQLIKNLKTTLDELPKALGYTGFAAIDNIEVEGARRSVHVCFQGEDFHIDVVPCIAPNGFENMIYVPDRGFNAWIASHPVGYINLITELNDKHGGKVRPLMKLVKHFRNVHMISRRPKSYWLGALVLHHITKDKGLDTTKSLPELFHDFCDAVYQQYDHLLDVSETATPNIPDPMLGHNISWNWERSHFETLMRRLDDGRKLSAKALKTDDREKAISYWQEVFGEEWFPKDVDEAARNLASSSLPGQSFITGAGIIKSTPPKSGPYTAVPKTTFHGDS